MRAGLAGVFYSVAQSVDTYERGRQCLFFRRKSVRCPFSIPALFKGVEEVSWRRLA